MKIYFAYRTGYEPNNRFIKEFEADSVLDFFQKYWDKLTSEEECDELLGIRVYGFPIQKYDADNDKSIIPDTPKTMEDLVNELYDGLYVNDLQNSDEFIQVWTDDDEIELLWCVFSEDFKNQNMDKLVIWFCETLPTNTTLNDKCNIQTQLQEIVIGDGSDYCYLVANTIYDSENSEGSTTIKIIGTDLPNLVQNIKPAQISDGYGFDVLKLIQAIATLKNNTDTNQVLNEFVKYDLSQIGSFEQLSESDDDGLSKVLISNHVAELCISSMGCFYNYYVIFDNHWANSHTQLAKSLIDFGQDWQFVESEDDDD